MVVNRNQRERTAIALAFYIQCRDSFVGGKTYDIEIMIKEVSALICWGKNHVCQIFFESMWNE